MGEAVDNDSGELQAILSREEPATMEELILKMDSVLRAVGRAGLSHTESFQRVYMHLTKRVNERMDDLPGQGCEPFFKESDSLEKTAKIFARYWFDPLQAHITEGKTPAKAWQTLLQSHRAQHASQGIQFLLGMSAHIIYDLPQALLESNPTQEYYDDFLAVDDLIYETAEELSQDLVLVRNSERKKMVTKLTTGAVKRWRAQSWSDYEMLKTYQDQGNSIAQKQLVRSLERRTIRTNNVLLSIGDTAMRAFDRAPKLTFL